MRRSKTGATLSFLTALWAARFSLGDEGAGFSVPQGRVIDAHYASACGPIACYVAIRTFDRRASLDDVAGSCAWAPGRKTTVEQMRATVTKAGLDCQPARLSPDKLIDLLRSSHYVAILAMRGGATADIDHAVCAVHSVGDSIDVVDYPALRVRYEVAELERRWDGAALLISDPRPARMRTVLMVAVIASLAIGAAFFVNPRRLVKNERRAE